MKKDKRMLISLLWITLGLILICLAELAFLEDYYSGMGLGSVLVGGLQFFRFHRLSTNEQYREKIEVEHSDERLRFLRNKAWAYTGYLSFFLCGIFCFVLRIIGFHNLSTIAGIMMSFLLAMYWISYCVLKRKY